MAAKQSRLGELLIQRGVINRQQLDAAIQEQDRTGKRLGQVLVHLGYASEKTILTSLTQGIDPNVSSEETHGKRSALLLYGGFAAGLLLLLIIAFTFVGGEEQRPSQSSLLAAANESLVAKKDKEINAPIVDQNDDEIDSKLVAYSSPQKIIEYDEPLNEYGFEGPSDAPLNDEQVNDSFQDKDIEDELEAAEYEIAWPSQEFETADNQAAEDLSFNSESTVDAVSFEAEAEPEPEPEFESAPELALKSDEKPVFESDVGDVDMFDTGPAEGVAATEETSDYSTTLAFADALDAPLEEELGYSYDVSSDSTIIQLQNVRFSVTDNRMQVVFESETSIKPLVLRTYENAYDVVYEFLNVSAANIELPDLVDNPWLARSAFVEENGVLKWKFRMKYKGSAKYSELAPNDVNQNYRFLVIIRQK